MSFEARVAEKGNYHQADPNVLSDPRNWPKPKKQQNYQEIVIGTGENEERTTVEDDNTKQ
ncbi:MAG: hypothetical protein J5507_06010 [Clostridia bacterium]|nr:hypothetical protein [Clostridia bacterium]